jgi:hypothetical protein
MIKQAAKKRGRPAGKTSTAKPAAKRPTARKTGSNPAAKRVTAKAAPGKRATKPAATPAKADKPKKQKIVRDSFTMPEIEYASIAAVKKACLAAGVEIKKSEILRIGVSLVTKLTPQKIKAAQAMLVPLKAGRPRKHK